MNKFSEHDVHLNCEKIHALPEVRSILERIAFSETAHTRTLHIDLLELMELS